MITVTYKEIMTGEMLDFSLNKKKTRFKLNMDVRCFVNYPEVLLFDISLYSLMIENK